MSNPQVTSAILEVVENQLRDGDPPETKATYDRLISQAHSDDEARRLIGAVVAIEIGEVLSTGKPFNQRRFVKGLRTCDQDFTPTRNMP